MKNYFITGIGTDVGKTLVSAVLTEALQADYWKPVQSGSDARDTDTVAGLISNAKSRFHKEAYLLKEPLSPHFAAKKEEITISTGKIILPETDNILLIEGAGGPLVPLNNKDYVIDLAKKFDASVILVVSNYLGCINHSLLCIDFLMHHGYKLQGIVLNGDFASEIEEAILGYKPVPVLARIPFSQAPGKAFVKAQAALINTTLFR